MQERAEVAVGRKTGGRDEKKPRREREDEMLSTE